MITRRFVFILLFSITAAIAAAEDFASIGAYTGTTTRFPVDARGEAMGLATTVDPHGPTAFWWNPAPLPESNRVDASYTVWEFPDDSFDWRPLAVRASLDNITFGFMWSRFSSEPILVQTAWEPDGDGRYVEPKDDLYLFGVSADLVPWLFDRGTRWAWTFGADAVYIRQAVDSASRSAWDCHLGTSLAWRAVDNDDAELRLHGTFTVRNVTRASLNYDGHEGIVPRFYHYGLGLAAATGPMWRHNRLLTATVSLSWHRDWDDQLYDYDSDHIGFELTAGGIFSLRAGHRTRAPFPDDGWSWGWGLQYRFDVWNGLRAAVDYGSFDVDNEVYTEELNHWTFTLGVDLPR